MNRIGVTTAGAGGRRRISSLALAAGVLAFLAAFVTGCGASAKPGAQPGSSRATTTASSTRSTSVKPTQTAASFDFNSTADCLDQFSGSGATRANADGAETASVAVPKDGNWDTFVSVEMYFFPTPAKAAAFAKRGGLELTETILEGNVVITGSAMVIPYSKEIVLKCLKVA